MTAEPTLQLDLCISDGTKFAKLIDCLKYSNIGYFMFKPDIIYYGELAVRSPKKGNNKNLDLEVSNTFELFPQKLERYKFNGNGHGHEYIIYFNVNELRDILGRINKDVKIWMYKTFEDENIYVRFINPTDSNVGFSCFLPLNVQNPEYVVYPQFSREDNNPNCFISPNSLATECKRIRAKNTKEIKLECHTDYILVDVTSNNNSIRQFIWGKSQNGGTPSGSPSAGRNNLNLRIDMDSLFKQDLKISPVKVNIDSQEIIEMVISSGIFKNLGKLSALNKTENIRIFVENSCIKFITIIGDFGVLRSYITRTNEII
ncbi:MAG TPA: hypothetical protein VKR58_12845 [Aquella sp.]|nr:hypothetical protein [Aquella sp.]